MAKSREPRDTHCYWLFSRGRPVYRGITNDPERRLAEHLREGKRFDSMHVDETPRTRSSAKRREAGDLAAYRCYFGRNPKYNGTDHG